MANRIKLVVGDWSHDGHEKTEDILIEVNVSSQELRDAHISGSNKLLGYVFEQRQCSDYQENDIDAKTCEILHDAGFDSWLYEEYEQGEGSSVDAETYAHIWLFLAQYGNPEIEYKVVSETDVINIGGYGLFD